MIYQRTHDKAFEALKVDYNKVLNQALLKPLIDVTLQFLQRDLEELFERYGVTVKFSVVAAAKGSSTVLIQPFQLQDFIILQALKSNE